MPTDPRLDGSRSTETRPRCDPPAKLLRVGATILLVSVSLMLLPLVWGRWSANRYFVAFGFFGACLALSLLLNGAWDWLARRRGGRR